MIKINLRNEIYQSKKEKTESFLRSIKRTWIPNDKVEKVRHWFFYFFKNERYTLSSTPENNSDSKHKGFDWFMFVPKSKSNIFTCTLTRITQILKPKGE